MIAEKMLSESKGIIHVGASIGDERHAYARYDLPVIWFEPILSVYQELCANIEQYPKQIAYPFLITDKVADEYEFHVSNNNGASSSIFDLHKHGEAWPEIQYVKDVKLFSLTLDSLDLTGDALVLDVQGAELLVLKGAEKILERIRFVQIEAYNAEMYRGGAAMADIQDFMASHGFRPADTGWFCERTLVHIEHETYGKGYGDTGLDGVYWYELFFERS